MLKKVIIISAILMFILNSCDIFKSKEKILKEKIELEFLNNSDDPESYECVVFRITDTISDFDNMRDDLKRGNPFNIDIKKRKKYTDLLLDHLNDPKSKDEDLLIRIYWRFRINNGFGSLILKEDIIYYDLKTECYFKIGNKYSKHQNIHKVFKHSLQYNQPKR